MRETQDDRAEFRLHEEGGRRRGLVGVGLQGDRKSLEFIRG